MICHGYKQRLHVVCAVDSTERRRTRSNAHMVSRKVRMICNSPWILESMKREQGNVGSGCSMWGWRRGESAIEPVTQSNDGNMCLKPSNNYLKKYVVSCKFTAGKRSSYSNVNRSMEQKLKPIVRQVENQVERVFKKYLSVQERSDKRFDEMRHGNQVLGKQGPKTEPQHRISNYA